MSYFDPTQNIAYNNKILYDFFKTTIQKNEIQSPDTNSSINYFKVPYVNNSSNPNFYYTKNGTTISYSIQNLYIFGLIHNNITGVSDNKNIIGELVIELNSTSGKCYVCFLLQKAPIYLGSTNGDIDLLLKLKNNTDDLAMDFTMNSFINNQESVIQYNSDSNNSSVFIFMSPINVNSDSAGVIKDYGITTNMFSTNAPTNYYVIKSNNISLKIDEQIYIDCNPTGESQETIQTYNLPINSELMNGKQEMDYMKTSVNFAMFAVLLVVSYFLVPNIYKFMVIDKIIYFFKKNNDIETNTGVNPVLTRIRSADILIGLYFFITASILFTIGMTNDNASMNYGFLFILVFYILSTSLIIDRKKDKTFMSYYYENKLFEFPYELTSNDRFTNFDDIWKFVGKVFKYVIFTAGPKVLIADLFFFITLLLLWLFGQINSSLFTFLSLAGCLYVLPILVPLLTLVNEGAIKSNKVKPE